MRCLLVKTSIRNVKNPTLFSFHVSVYVNSFDQRVGYHCPDGGMVSGLISYHSNNQEDRRWRVKCCRSNGKLGIIYESQSLILSNPKRAIILFQRAIIKRKTFIESDNL